MGKLPPCQISTSRLLPSSKPVKKHPHSYTSNSPHRLLSEGCQAPPRLPPPCLHPRRRNLTPTAPTAIVRKSKAAAATTTTTKEKKRSAAAARCEDCEVEDSAPRGHESGQIASHRRRRGEEVETPMNGKPPLFFSHLASEQPAGFTSCLFVQKDS